MLLDACDTAEESQERLRALFASMTDLVAIVDRRGALRAVNQPAAWEALFGAPPGRGERLAGASRTGDLAALMAPLLDACLEGGGATGSCTQVLTTGERRLQVSVLPFAGGAVVSLRDETGRIRTEEERRVAEARLRQAQKMEAIGTLAGGIAHDFNNILWVIAGNNELAMVGLPTAHPIRRHLMRIEQACGRAQNLVKQILNFSRQGEQERQPLQIGTIVKESLKLLRPALPAGIEIRSAIIEDAGTIMADLPQINQVLMALYSNAVDAMGSQGLLEVSLERRNLSAETAGPLAGLESGDYVVLTVADSGAGIAPEDMERIFDPFFTTKPVDRGTGLGLSVAHGILRSHGGAIRVQSALERGSVFQVFLPLLAEVEAAPAGAFDTLPRGKERILFIDDNQAVLEVGTEMLTRLGYHVTSRQNPEEALALFRDDPSAFDLVLTDQTMPHLTGDRLAVALMEMRPELPVIMCTGHSERVSAEVMARIGVRAILTKPLTGASLANTLRQALD
jgi:signal transduction histidine kinase/BarA-like signal transduction histidine kinase